MPEEYCINSYAKINLHLDVGNRREDGFHDIYSVFQLISLHDRISAFPGELAGRNTPFKDIIEIKGKFTCKPEENLVFKAAVRFMEETGIRSRIEFSVEKNIPEGAGLGGGSSNCAAALQLLNRIFDYPLDNSRLSRIAAGTGSDVRFFLEGEPAAIVRGKGEIIEKLEKPIPASALLLVYPGFRIKTAEAYSWLDAESQERKLAVSSYPPQEPFPEPSEWKFFNSFRTVLEKKYPVYREIFEVFKKTNADYANITGSGSAVFAVYSSENRMNEARRILSGFCPEIWILDTLAGKPLLE